MASFLDTIRAALSGGGGGQPRYEDRTQPVRGGGSNVRDSSGAPVVSRFGTAAPIESRSIGDAVRVAMMQQQPEPVGVPLEPDAVVKPMQAQQQIVGTPLEEEPIVQPYNRPEPVGVPLEPEGMSAIEAALRKSLGGGSPVAAESPMQNDIPRVGGTPAGMPDFLAQQLMPGRGFIAR